MNAKKWMLAASLSLVAWGAQALQITSFSPQGEVARVRQVVAKFDSAAVNFGDPKAPAPLSLSCSDASVTKGEAAGVRLSTAYLVQTAITVGETARARDAIARDASHRAEHAPDPRWAMLDTYASQIVLHESDRIWTELTGSRTPLVQVGTFPDTPPPGPSGDDDLLGEGLFP